MRRLTLILATLASLATSLASSLSGQAQVEPGDRVRILTAAGESLTGTLVVSSPEAMRLDLARSSVLLAREDIAYIERSAGRYRHFGRNFGLPVAIGALGLGSLAAATWSPCQGFCLLEPESRGDAFALGAIVGAVLSLPVGVVLGLALQYDRWEPVSRQGLDTSRISIAPVLGNGVGVAASVSF